MKRADDEKLIRLHGFGGSAGLPAYLVRCDFEARHGAGEVFWTTERDEAMRFDSAEAAVEYWQTQSQTVPIRPDGKPNRPLTAFTAEIVPVEDAVADLRRRAA